MTRLCGTGWEELSPEERELVETCFTDPLIRDMVRPTHRYEMNVTTCR